MDQQQDKKQVFQQEFDTITDQPQGFDVAVSKPGWLHKLGLKKKLRTFYIYPANLATLAQISKIYQEIGIDETTIEKLKNGELKQDDVHGFVVSHTDQMVEIIAHAVMNSDRKPSKALKRFLKYNLTASEVVRLIVIVNEKMDLANFMIGIALGKGVNLKQETQE